MPSIRERFEDDFVFDEHGVLRPGATARIRMTARDSDTLRDKPLTIDEMHARMASHRAKSPIHDGSMDPWSLSRPGFRFNRSLGDAQRQRVADARAAYIRDLEAAWKTATTTGSLEHGSPQVGGERSRERDDDGRINKRASGDSASKSLPELQRDHAIAMEAAYAEHAEWLSNRWRTK